ncbi:MAG: hypothetical protein EZS28_023063, partial [Streblomastix strix]
MTNQHPTE